MATDGGKPWPSAKDGLKKVVELLSPAGPRWVIASVTSSANDKPEAGHAGGGEASRPVLR